METLKASDGEIIGNHFFTVLNTSANEDGVVEAWIRSFPALDEFACYFDFFVPMMSIVAKSVLGRVTLWKLLLSVGTSLFSIIDFASDIYTIQYYYNNSLRNYAFMMTGSLLFTMFTQLLLVFMLYGHNFREFVYESLLTITYIKPGINKFR